MARDEEVTPSAQLAIGIEKTNSGIGIPASRILVRYRTKKNAGLHQLGPERDLSRHR
jgi:hypothetical protein